MIVATPAPDKPPTPVVKIGEACRAASMSATLKFDKQTYLITMVEVCGNRVVLHGHRIRVAR